jgi:hypothetical protein
MDDPIFKAAADLKKELSDVQCPEAHAAMEEIMKLLLECTQPGNEQKKP